MSLIGDDMIGDQVNRDCTHGYEWKG